MVLLPSSGSDGMTDGSVALCNAFHYIRGKSSAAKALSFLTDVRGQLSFFNYYFGLDDCKTMF